MNSLSKRGLLLAVAMLSVLAVAAAPAHATLTPVNTDIVGAARDSTLNRGGVLITCDTSTFAGRTSAAGNNVSGTIDFLRNCRESAFRTACTVTTTGTLTLRVTASTARTSAEFDVFLDASFNATVTCPTVRVSATIQGPQTLTGPNGERSCARATQGRPSSLRPNCLVRVTEGGTSLFSGTYAVRTAGGGDVTIS